MDVKCQTKVVETCGRGLLFFYKKNLEKKNSKFKMKRSATQVNQFVSKFFKRFYTFYSLLIKNSQSGKKHTLKDSKLKNVQNVQKDLVSTQEENKMESQNDKEKNVSASKPIQSKESKRNMDILNQILSSNFSSSNEILSTDTLQKNSKDLKDSSCLVKFLVTKKALFSTLSAGNF